jgi:aminomethyltransferase
MAGEFIGKAALLRIKQDGARRKQVGLVIDDAPLTGPNTVFWPVFKDHTTIGKVTSAVYSPRLGQNIALALLAADRAEIGSIVEVATRTSSAAARIVERPFFDPRKRLVAPA